MSIPCGDLFDSRQATFGTVIVRTPLSIAAFSSSTFAFSGKQKRRRKLSCARSTRCQRSVEEVSSFLRSALICRTRPFSTCTFTSSFANPAPLNSNKSSKAFCSANPLQSTLHLGINATLHPKGTAIVPPPQTNEAFTNNERRSGRRRVQDVRG